MVAGGLVVAATGGLAGCMLKDLQQQVEMLDQACLIEGRLEIEGGQGQAVVVALAAAGDGEAAVPEPVDYTLPEASGSYSFALAPGAYHLLAFQDRDDDLELDTEEPARRAGWPDPLQCGAGQRLGEQRIVIEVGDRLPGEGGLMIRSGRNLVADAMASAVSLGQLTAFGEVVPLDDPRFALETARDSLWRPVDFLRAGHTGVYLSEAYDPGRTPVLFIHGINGSPRVLAPMIERLDGGRFQPMYLYYASGLRIDQIAWHLDRIMRELEHRFGMKRYHVVAHSMGGLVARAWLLERSRQSGRAEVGAFVSLSTPWGGYPSAKQGVDHSPVVVPVWRDMASGSDFLASLFRDEHAERPLPSHHLLFSFRQSGWLPAASGDGTAALASMLPPQVQRQAASVFGVDSGHVDILSEETAQARVESLLLQSER
jgi:pimeloyl-ACP methyl ester carboxylesterase